MSRSRGRSGRLFWAGARTVGRSLLAGARSITDPDARDRFWTGTGEDWFRTLSDMKGAAMKLGQLASQYDDMLPPQLSAALKRLQKDSQPRPFEEIDAVLNADWSPAQRARVRDIEPGALAAASIGQVHRARLDDGRAVVLKVRYPGVRESVAADVAALARLFRMAKVLPVDGRSLDAVMAEIRDRFMEETDYTIERENLVGLRKRNRYPWIVFPEPVNELCVESIMVMTDCPAPSLESARAWPQAQRDRLGDHFARWVVSQVFDTGWLHADPHAGNFGVEPDGRIIVYDAGCVQRVERGAALRMARVVDAVWKRDWPALHACLIELGALKAGSPIGERERALYSEIVDAVLLPLIAEPTWDFSDNRIIETARVVARRHFWASTRYQPVSELVFVMRTFSGAYWLLRSLGARVRMRALLAAVARRARRA
jgi:predicted unusual protein kinase regulating ubiquinone biosynthesis (AarF/ABC1/UbiB family)